MCGKWKKGIEKLWLRKYNTLVMQLGISKKVEKKESAFMRKQTKWAVVLGAAAVMTFGACMTSFAASGWVEEDGDWYWYDNNGDAVEDEWKKASNGKWYYLGDDGAMVTDAMIDDEYYVDENGVRVTNQWRKLTSISDDAEEAWFYFSSTGKVYTDTTRTINGKKYTFDADGEMESGWVEINNKWYYHGDEDDGARYTSTWGFLEDEDEDDEYWYYFPSAGNRDEGRKRKVNGKTYYFDADGRMLTGWADVAAYTKYEQPIDNASYSNVRYLGEEEDGVARMSAWAFLAEPHNENSEEKWYYFDSNGKLYVGNGSAEDSIKKINSKYYAFDDEGKMLTGGKVLTFKGDDSFYFFGNSSDGSMKTGKTTITDTYDDSYTAYFSSTGTISTGRGRGVDDEKSGVLYVNGLRIEAPEDSKYGYYSDGNGMLLVSEAGKIQKKKNNLKTGGEYYVSTDENGYVNKVASSSGGNDLGNWASYLDEVENSDSINGIDW